MSQTTDIKKEEQYGRSRMLEVLILIMLLLLLIVAFWDSIFITIPAGHKGVLFRTLAGGTVTDRYYDEGLVLVLPWNEMYVYDTRIISGQDSIEALTEDGLQVRAEISYRFRPKIDSLGNMHKNLGLDYADKIIVPHVTAATRDVISRYRIDALYTTSRSDIQADMLAQVRSQVDSFYSITTIDLIVRNIALDETVEQAIADKLVQEQEMLAYDFILEREMREEERKLIEARGIKLFRDTSGIDILKWKGIEATEKLATSPNAKVVIVGTDSGEMPVILGGGN
jgi:regulator of protease activity HflC (stomatin/prohibitin superfamily)